MALEEGWGSFWVGWGSGFTDFHFSLQFLETNPYVIRRWQYILCILITSQIIVSKWIRLRVEGFANICFMFPWERAGKARVEGFSAKGYIILTPGQCVSTDWGQSFPYPVQMGHLQLRQIVVLSSPLVHVFHLHPSKLHGFVKVRPVTDTFVLHQRNKIAEQLEWDGGRGCGGSGGCLSELDKQNWIHSSGFCNRLNCHTILVSRLPYFGPHMN